jgi:hypothetical protein
VHPPGRSSLQALGKTAQHSVTRLCVCFVFDEVKLITHSCVQPFCKQDAMLIAWELSLCQWKVMVSRETCRSSTAFVSLLEDLMRLLLQKVVTVAYQMVVCPQLLSFCSAAPVSYQRYTWIANPEGCKDAGVCM